MIKAVLFDLDGTLGYVKNPLRAWEVSEYLVGRGYEVYPQEFQAAWSFVSMVDYTRYGCRSFQEFIRRVLHRLEVEVDDETLDGLTRLYEDRHTYELHADALSAITQVKKLGMKTAIVTTIARFRFERILQDVGSYIDVVMDGYEARCEKSNPKMYKEVLRRLDVAPSEAVVVGDDVELEVILPKKLGMKTILLDREGKKRSNIPHAVVSSLNDVVKVVSSWQP